MAKTEVSAAPGGERPLECLLRGSFEPTRWKKSYLRFRNSVRFVLHPPFSSNYLLLDDFIYHLRQLFDKKYGRLKSLCKISFRRIFSISISLNKTTTTTTTIPRKSNSRRSVPRESPLSTFPFTVKIAAMGSRNRSPRCRNPTPRIYIASRFFPTYYTRSTI